MAEAGANNEPVEQPPASTDQRAADLPGGEQRTNDDEASTEATVRPRRDSAECWVRQRGASIRSTQSSPIAWNVSGSAIASTVVNNDVITALHRSQLIDL